MEYRTLGRTGLRVSEIGFGTGGISRLMVEGDRDAQRKAVRLALEEGITFFDTAAGYGQGKSEAALGHALKDAHAPVTVSTKIRLGLDDLGDPAGATVASAEASLERLQRESVDLVQIHNLIAPKREWPIGLVLSPKDVLKRGGVLTGLKKLRDRGLVRHFGLTGLGDPVALAELVDSGQFDTIQTYFNLLNPTAGHAVQNHFGALDYRGLLDRAAAAGMGVLVIRVLALGALSESPDVWPLAPPLLSLGSDYPSDRRRAEKLRWLVEEHDDIATLSQAAVRFALMKPGVSTVLIGFSSAEQIQEITSCSGAGPLPEDAMARLQAIWDSDFSGNKS